MTVVFPGRNLVLAGMMGTGKSTVGALVAMRLARPFVDTDVLVEREAGASIADLFRERGERAFRDLEASAIRAVSSLRGQVVAVGGGALLRPDNVTALRGTGDIAVLDAEPEVLAGRVAAAPGSRPLLAGTGQAGGQAGHQAGDPGADRDRGGDLVARLRALRAARHGAYASAAATVIDTSALDAEDVADAVLAWARAYPGLLAREESEALA